MEKLIKTSLLIICATLFMYSCSDDDDDYGYDDFLIEYSTLPNISKNFINTHFVGYSPTSTTQKHTANPINGSYYKVYLTGGYEIDFTTNGQWISLESDNLEFPASLFGTEVPSSIKIYVDNTYPNQHIKEIDKISSGFKVELSNDLDLFFDKSGNLIQ